VAEAQSLHVLDVPLPLLDRAPSEVDSRTWSVKRAHLDELAASIRDLGLLQPVGVRLQGERFVVVYGHRRVAAAVLLGWLTIPAVLVDAPSDEDPLRSLVENIQRRQLSPAERADALERLVATGIGGKELARRLGMSPNVIWSWLKIGRSPMLLQALRDEKIGIHQARQMASLDEATIAALLPELWGRTEPWMQARIARAVDDQRQRPPNGTFARHAESHTVRTLGLIFEYAQSIKEIRDQTELDLMQQIIDLVARWKRDLLRVRSGPP
jgi:ParB/RepB/Spo0J family partition protein